MEPVTYGWLIPTISPDDYLLGNSDNVMVMLSENGNPSGTFFEKNQARDYRYRNTCTITSAILAICDLFGESITDKELDKVCEEAIRQGLDPNYGWSFWKAVDCARRYWNRTRPDKKVVSFRIPYGDKEYDKALGLGYTLVCGYQGNSGYNADKDDGVLSWLAFPNPTYSHCIRKVLGENLKAVDNYFGIVKHNVYVLDNPDDLQKNGVFYPSHYVFVRKDALTQSQKDRIEAKQRKLWNGERENAKATRLECAVMCARAIGTSRNPTNKWEAMIAVNAGIWNGDRGTDPCSRLEAQIMINRAMKSDIAIAFLENPITRGETVELLIRAIHQKETK